MPNGPRACVSTLGWSPLTGAVRPKIKTLKGRVNLPSGVMHLPMRRCMAASLLGSPIPQTMEQWTWV